MGEPIETPLGEGVWKFALGVAGLCMLCMAAALDSKTIAASRLEAENARLRSRRIEVRCAGGDYLWLQLVEGPPEGPPTRIGSEHRLSYRNGQWYPEGGTVLSVYFSAPELEPQ